MILNTLLLLLPCLPQVNGELTQSFTISGAGSYSRLGWSSHLIDDIDFDGYSDFILSDYRASQIISAYSSQSGDLLWGFTSPGGIGSGFSVIGDINNDGFRDIATSRELSGEHKYLSFIDGSNGMLLHTIVVGIYDIVSEDIVSIGDLNNDGIEEIAVKAWVYPNHHIHIIDPTGQSVFPSVTTTKAVRQFTLDTFSSLVSLDVDGDGFKDLLFQEVEILNDPFWPATYARHYLIAWSFQSSSVLWETHIGKGSGSSKIITLPDQNNDDISELCVRAYAESQILLIDGKTGSQLDAQTKTGVYHFNPEAFLGDFDGNGSQNLLVTTMLGWNFGISLDFEIWSLEPLRYEYSLSFPKLGYQVGYIDFAPNEFSANSTDHTGTLIISSPESGPRFDGITRALQFNPFTRPERTELSISGSAFSTEIDFPEENAHQPYWTLASFKGTGPTLVGDTSIPLSPDSLTYTMLLGMQPPFMDTNWRGTLDAQGDASFSFTPSPLLAPLVGLTLHHATVCLGTTNNVPVLSSVAWPLVITP